ncbi:MAG: OFA family MFS transporter [Phycisphaerae bacterium]|nr:OFA family MFS transporter [Phycisphaerae bacterium]
MLAAIAIQLTLGIAYLWSLFQTGVANRLFGGDNAAASLTFSILLAMLALGSVLGGKLAVAYSPRIVVFAGGVILSAGFFLASFVPADHAWLLWVTYGFMGGLGMGFSYSTTIACAQKWYPRRKGLVTGIIVSALGFGGVLFTPVIERMLAAFGGTEVGEARTFMVLSAVFLAVCSVGSLFMKNPPEGHAVSGGKAGPSDAMADRSYSPMEMLKTPQFYLIAVSFLLACLGGLMVIGFAKPIAVDKGLAETAAVGVLAISLFNSVGRLFWGFVSDRMGRMNTIILLLSGNAVLPLFVHATEGYWVFVLIALIGFFYGGLLSTFPSLTADAFGAKHMATNYGLVLLGFGAGAIFASQIAGYYKNLAGGDIGLMFPAFVIASCGAAVGAAMMGILKVLARRNGRPCS